MGSDPLARRLWPRVGPEARAALEAAAARIREAHPAEPTAVLLGRLAAEAQLEDRGAHATDADADASVLTVERRAAAYASLRAQAPGELLDGTPVRWAQEVVDRDAVIGFWREWIARRRAERLFVYLHVPFCRTKCGFCQFDSVVGHGPEVVQRNLEATLAEAGALERALGPLAADAITVGGGTPSELSAAQLDALLEGIVGRLVTRDAETYFSVELNPDSTDAEKLATIARHGVNRVSFGAQSLHAPTLKAIARGYQTSAMVEDALAAARATAGLKVAVDLIASLPEETLESFRDGARRVIAAEPDQIVLYEYQPVTRRGRTMDAGPLALADAEEALLELADAAGYRRVPHTGSSVIVERDGARGFDVRYVQHAREPTSVLGLGPFAESHAFGVASYVTGPDVGAPRPYRALDRDRDEELATYIGRRLAAAMPLEDSALERYFGGSLAELSPHTLGYLLERGEMAETDGGYRATGSREDAIGAAWGFSDARSLVRLRQRAAGGLPLDKTLEALDSEPVARRAGPLLDGAIAVSAVARQRGDRRTVGLAVELAVEELDDEAWARWLAPWVEAEPLRALARHRLLASLAVEIFADRAVAQAELAAPAPGMLRCVAPGLEVPDPSWWARVIAARTDDGRLALQWNVDRARSRLWAAARRGLAPPLVSALERASLRFERGAASGDALVIGDLEDDEALRSALPRTLREARGRLRSLRLPLTGARPRLEELEVELSLRGRRALHTVSG